jgi:hypothetical protein
MTFRSWPRSGRICADRHHQEMRRRPLMVSAVEGLVDAVRYVTIMLIITLLLGQLAKVAV